MWRSPTFLPFGLGCAFLAGMAVRTALRAKGKAAPRYLRVSVAHWNIDLYSPDAEQTFHQIATDGLAVFRAQPGFVSYRLMRADSTTTVAVAEWESEPLGQAGAEQYRAWMRQVGIMDRFTLETRAGEIVVGPMP